MVDFRGFTPFIRADITADLLAIIPPKASLSPYSKLTPDKIGKLPGLPTEDGWIGHTDWPDFTNSQRTLATWVKELGGQPFNVGINARTYHAFDVDTKSREFAAAILPVIERHLAPSIKLTGIRIGRAPGFLVPFKPITPMRKARIVFEDAIGDKHAIERLGVGQQYVLAGVHPSGVPYRWVARGGSTFPELTTPLPPITIDFQAFTQDCVDAVAGKFDLAKRAADRIASAPGSPLVAQEALLAPDVADVEEALAALPNRPEDKRDRDEWITFLHAIAGATGKSEEGKALWMSWSAQWGDQELDAEARWDSLDASGLHLGWPWLSEKASGADAAFRLTHAIAEFDQPVEHLNGHAVDTEGLFDEPAHDHPTREEIQNAIDLLTPSATGPEIQAVTKLIARSRVLAVDHAIFLRQIKAATKYPLAALQRQLQNDIADQFRDAGDIGIRLAQVALNKLGDGKVAFYKGRWWQYDGRVWVTLEEVVIRAVLTDAIRDDERLLQGRGGGQAHSDAMIRQGISMLTGMTSKLLTPMDDPEFALRPSLNFRNGTLDISSDGGTINFRKHDPKDCFTWMINADYDELASCPMYDATLRDMLSLTWHRLSTTAPDYPQIKAAVDRASARQDKPLILPDGRLAWRMLNTIRIADIDDNVRMVNEILGYMMTPDRSARCFAVLKGNGINGKSALIQTVTARLTGMTYNATLELLKSRFTISQLRGKRVLIVDEGTHGTLADDVIKMLCENKPIDADVKGRETIQFMLTTFPVILTNNFFTTPDASEGMLSRIVFVPFNRRYDEQARLSSPWQAIQGNEEEISGIMNRLIDGLRRVLARKFILVTQASLQMKEHWRQRNTPEAAFIADAMTEDRPEGEKSEGEMVAKIHASYVWWFNQNIGGGQRPRGKMRFAEVFSQLGYEVYKSDGMDRIRGLWLDPDKLARLSGSSEFEPLGSEF